MNLITKRKALIKLHKHLGDGEWLVQHHYVERMNGKPCYCAVGFLMNECGIDMTQFEEDGELNGSHIDSPILEHVAKQLQEHGFDIKELNRLQMYNDENEDVEMYFYIDNLILEN